MPKEIYEIKDFRLGTVTAVSEKDLPASAASLSFNLDPYANDGKLRGVQASKVMSTSGWATSSGIDGFNGEHSSVINNKGTRTLVFYDNDTNKYKYVTDIDATSGVSISDTFDTQGSSSAASMIANNTELHIGRGGLEPQWLGYPQYKQFGIDNSSSLTLESAKLESSSYLDAFYKVVSIVEGDPGVRYFFGVKYKGNYVYKFAQTGDDKYKLISKSAHRFGSIQGLALRYANISAQSSGLYQEPVLWIYDAGVGEFGTVYIYDGKSLTTSQENALTAGPTRDANDEIDSVFSDIMEHDGKLWFGRGYDGNTKFKNDLIWNANIPSSGDSLAPTNRTPKLLNFYGTTSTGSNTDVAGWTTGVEKGNFGLIPVDSLTLADSGGEDQCFSVPLGSPQRAMFYASYGGPNNAAEPRQWDPSGNRGRAISGAQGDYELSLVSFRSDSQGAHQVHKNDEIGPLFKNYWTSNPPVPRNQQPRFSNSYGWEWTLTNIPDTTYHDVTGHATLIAAGILNSHSGTKITTTSSYTDKLVPYEMHGYHGTTGWTDPRAQKILDNNYDRSVGFNDEDSALSEKHVSSQTEFQHTPLDYIDHEYGLIFWASNDFKGSDAMHGMGATTSWLNLTGANEAATVTAMAATGWADGNISSTTNGNMDLRRLGKTEINHNIYSRKFNGYNGTLAEYGEDLIQSEMLEDDFSSTATEGWVYTADHWVPDVDGGITHAAGNTTALYWKGSTDTITDGAVYQITFSSTGNTGSGSIKFKVGNSGSYTATFASASYSGQTVESTAAATLWQGKTGSTLSEDYSKYVIEITPTSDFDGKITNVQVKPKPMTNKIMLPTSFNNAAQGSIQNTIYQPIGVNYTTPGYRHTSTYPSFNMNNGYNTGEELHTEDNGDQQYHETGTNLRTTSANIAAQPSQRTSMSGKQIRRAFNFVNPFPQEYSWHLNDFCGQHMPFDRHIMAVDTRNKYIFVVNPLHKGYGFPNTDICEIDTGATTTHCIENDFTKGSAALATDTITFSGGVDTTDLWVGMTVSHTDIPAGAYITSIESSTVIKINTNVSGTPSGQTVTFGRYISTDQGTGGNRNVIYIYQYDRNGKMSYKGFKHIVRDCHYDYRGENGLPKGSINDHLIQPTDIYVRKDKDSIDENFLIINQVNTQDGWDTAFYNGTKYMAIDEEHHPRARRNSIIKIKYSADLSSWEAPSIQTGNYSLDASYETDTISEQVLKYYTQEGNSGLQEGWRSGITFNTQNSDTDSAGGGGHGVCQTAIDDQILFKVTLEGQEGNAGPLAQGRTPTLFAVKTRTTSASFNDTMVSGGKLQLTSPAYQTISDLRPEYGDSIYEENASIDFIAIDKASKVIYVGTSRQVNHPEYGTTNHLYKDAVINYTSIQSFPYDRSLSVAEGTSDEFWPSNEKAIRSKARSGKAIDHIVLSNVHTMHGSHFYDGTYDGGSGKRSTNPFAMRYRQGYVTNHDSNMNMRYYDSDGDEINNPFEAYTDDNGVVENLPQGRYLILGGGGASVSYKNTAKAGNRDENLKKMSILRAIPVTVDGHFIKDPDRRRKQDFFKGTGVVQHNDSDGNPWDISAGTYSLTRENTWGLLSANELDKTVLQVGSDDPLYEVYDHAKHDQDIWYQSRALDGPMLGYSEQGGFLFTMGGMRSCTNELSGNVKTFKHSNTHGDREDTQRQYRLYSVNLMHHHPISSPLANLVPVGADGGNKFGGVVFGIQGRNSLQNKIIKDSTIATNGSVSDRQTNKNTLQTITSVVGRWVVGAIDVDQTNGLTNEIFTASKKADGASAGESRLFGIGTHDEHQRLDGNYGRSLYNMHNVVRVNNTQIFGFTQNYDDTKLNAGGSVDYRYSFTFGRNSYYDPTGMFNKNGVGILSADGSNPHTSAQIRGALAHGYQLNVLHNIKGGITGDCNMIHPFPLGIKHGTTGAETTSAAQDIDIHLLIGSSFSPQPLNNPQAGWALGGLKYVASSNSVLNLNNNDLVGTGGKLSDTISITVSNLDEGSWSTSGNKYFYRASFMYDGYQEGPLGDDYVLNSSEGRNHKLEIRLDIGSFSKRATHLNLYRGDNVQGSSSPLGFYRLVESIRLDSRWTTGTDPNTSPAFSGFKYLDYTDTGYSGADYESNSGIPEVVDDSSLNYHYSCELNNQLYVAKIGHRMLDNGESTIAKSLPYNYDMFDITKDILRMPSTPVGISEYGNRIWVFDEGNTYKVEPSNLYIEEAYKGSGCFSQKSFVSTEYGLFYCDNNNIYSIMQDGIPREIGSAIKTGSTYSWDNKNLAHTPLAGYDANLKTVLFTIKIASAYYAWGYNIPNTRWDLYKLNNDSTSEVRSFTNDKYGNLLFNTKNGSNEHYLYQFGTDGAKHLDWEWVSKDFTLGHDNVYKKIYNIKKDGDGTVTYSVTSEETPSSSLVGTDSIVTGSRKTKKIKIKVASGSNNTNKYELDSLGIIFRRLKVTST